MYLKSFKIDQNLIMTSKICQQIGFWQQIGLRKVLHLPLRFRKAGRVWCGGAWETHWATYQNGVTPSKTKKFLKSPCFLRSSWFAILFSIAQSKSFLKHYKWELRNSRHLFSQENISKRGSSNFHSKTEPLRVFISLFDVLGTDFNDHGHQLQSSLTLLYCNLTVINKKWSQTDRVQSHVQQKIWTKITVTVNGNTIMGSI